MLGEILLPSPKAVSNKLRREADCRMRVGLAGLRSVPLEQADPLLGLS